MRRIIIVVCACVATAGATTAGIELTTPPACNSSEQAIVVNLDNDRHALVLDHAWDAITAGEARLLHLDREGADENRDDSLRGIPTKPGYDRDEYPPAVSSEGGAGADVRYVPSSENRSAGSIMGRQLRGWCDGQEFVFEDR